MAFQMNLAPRSTLAAVQQEQSGNNCAIFSTCAALQLLWGINLDPYEWSDRLDNIPFPALLKMRMCPNGPVTPRQHIQLIHWLAREAGNLNLMCFRGSGTPDSICRGLQMPNLVQFVTIGWWFERPPEITYGDSAVNQNASTARAGYHTLILAAHDSNHISRDGLQRPWGFINSWKSNAVELYWMQDNEFQRGWRTYTPFGGRNALVTLVKIN